MQQRYSRRPQKKYLFVIVGILGFFIFVPSLFAEEAGRQWIPVAMHVGTTISDGNLSLAEIIAVAREKGHRAVIVTDRDMMKWEYGLWPLRNIIKKTIEMNSIFKYGINNYLKDIELESKKNPDMLIIPGVEASPYYRWEGTPFTNDFKILNWHRHILVVGLDKPRDYRYLPAVANKKGIRRRIALRDFLMLTPLAALAFGFWLTRLRECSYRDAQGKELGRYSPLWRVIGMTVMAVATLLLADRLPYFPQTYSQYGRSAGAVPYQMLIDYANKRGALTFWAHPEAENITERDGIKIETREHTAYLYKTHGYTGFSIFHEGYEKAGKVGGDWDALLNEFCDGRRSEPVWVTGGLAFDQGRREDLARLMDDVRLYVSAREFSREAVLEAMRRGAMYVSRNSAAGKNQLFLEKFALEDEATRMSAGMGGRLRVAGAHAVVIRGRFALSQEETKEVKIRLIRDGKIIREWAVSGEPNIRHIEPRPEKSPNPLGGDFRDQSTRNCSAISGCPEKSPNPLGGDFRDQSTRNCSAISGCPEKSPNPLGGDFRDQSTRNCSAISGCPEKRRSYYRLEIVNGPQLIVTNPIFVDKID